MTPESAPASSAVPEQQSAPPSPPDTPSSSTVPEPQSAPAPAVSQAFQDGATDRHTWETWFASLSGDIHDGAAFWAAERSNKSHPPACSGGQPKHSDDFTHGCSMAKKFLDQVDKRRHTEADYWRGWNSL
jgi:hypothetical protein